MRKAGIDKKWVTSSGYMSCVSASGKYLGNQPTDAVLEAFEALPVSERKAGAMKVPEIAESEQVIPNPPHGGIILNVHARFLAKDENGKLRHAALPDFPLIKDKSKSNWALFLQPNTETMWITENEWRSLLPENPTIGQRFKVNSAIPIRMARFHLNPKRATTSEGGIISEKEVKAAEMELVVTEVAADIVSMQIEGKIHWGSEFDKEKGTSPNGELASGFATKLLGRVEFDREKETITRFDLVASGEVWGRWGDANNNSISVERAGKTPFGFAFELATGDSPTERIPPGGNAKYVGDKSGYFSAVK